MFVYKVMPDCLSAEQFAIDIETVAEIPPFLSDSADRNSFITTVIRYLRGFKSRGWSVYLNVRDGLQREILLREEVEVFDLETIHKKPGQLGFFVVNDEDNTDYRNFYERYKYTDRIESYWLVYFLREWINELLLGYYKKILDQLNINLMLTNCAWGFDHFLGGDKKKITSFMIEERQKYSIY